MTADPVRAQAIALYDAFTHAHLDRRQLMDGLVRLTGSAAAASGLLALIAADADAAPIVPETDNRVVTRDGAQKLSTGRELKLYTAFPAAPGKYQPVIVIHENRGLNAHIKDVARRVAVAGFAAVAPDFLTVSGGTPADEDAARQAIAALNRDETVADAAALTRALHEKNGRVGAMGFCWGGGMVNALAIAAGKDLAAAVPFYGPAPADLAKVNEIRADMLIHLAGDDERVNAGYPAYEEALRKAKVRFEIFRYAGAQHAFNNDTSAARYNKDAAELAWKRSMDFFARELKGR